MTLNELYRYGKQTLRNNEIEDYTCDALMLMQNCFGVDRIQLTIHGNETADADKETEYRQKIARRSEGYPLQYLIGTWNFMERLFYVGEGVLVPREDTEVVVRAALKRMEGIKNPRVIDLCSGSGAIAVTLALERPDAEIYALELSETAFGYMQKNIAFHNADNVKPLLGDVFTKHTDFADHSFDVIVSNPPYICSGEISTLSREVLNEPHLALDGGIGGIDFYISIIKNWTAKIKPHGSLCFEFDPAQAKTIAEKMTAVGFGDIKIFKDFNEMDRAISGKMMLI